MASPFKTKVAMREIVQGLCSYLNELGFRVVDCTDDNWAFYLDEEYAGTISISYDKSNKEYRQIHIGGLYNVMLHHKVVYAEDNVKDIYEIRTSGSTSDTINENELDKLDKVKHKMAVLSRNYKLAKGKLKEIKMKKDFT